MSQPAEDHSFGRPDEVGVFPNGRAEVPEVGGSEVGRAMSQATALEVVQAFGSAWEAHDLDAAVAFLTEDCVFDSTAPAPDGTCYIGREAIREAWQPIFDDASSRFEPEETFAAGDRVVQRWCYSWDGGHVRGLDLFRLENGRVAEKLSYVKG